MDPKRPGWVRALAPKEANADYFARMAFYSLFAGGLVHGTWALFAPAGANAFEIAMASGPGVALLVALIVAHELIHLASYPRAPGSSRGAGCDIRRMVLYVRYHGPIGKWRRIFCAALPFALLSFGPLVLAILAGCACPELAYIAFWNALVSASDLDNCVRFARALPGGVPLVQDHDGIWVVKRAMEQESVSARG
jgi:hypothetical protein